jgi:hypothetical protein
VEVLFGDVMGNGVCKLDTVDPKCGKFRSDAGIKRIAGIGI